MKHFVLAALFACSVSQASAATLDFETGTTQFDDVISFGGFNFSFNAGGWFIGNPGGANYPNGVTNGSGILVASGGTPASVTMTQVGGGTFDLFGLLAASSNLFIGNTLDIVGNLFGGGTVTHSVAVGGSFASIGLSGFEDLTSVTFSSGLFGGYNNAGIALDNLQLDPGASPIPVPASLPLLLLGLGSIAAVRRARKA